MVQKMIFNKKRSYHHVFGLVEPIWNMTIVTCGTLVIKYGFYSRTRVGYDV